jgi:hypothetical protein
MPDNENRHGWYDVGQRREWEFIQIMRRAGHDVRRNPRKALEPYAPDLKLGSRDAELKAERKPFFTAGRYDMEPRFTFTFNRKDYERYMDLCPDLYIYFWAWWTEPTLGLAVVEPINRIYGIEFADLHRLIEKAPEHYYNRRNGPDADPRPNAKSSFLLDVREMTLVLALDSEE